MFGRKINLAEDPILLVKIMREVVESNIKPKDAVKLYHSELKKNKLIPDRKLLKDVEITEKVLKL